MPPSEAAAVVESLKRLGSRRVRDGMARYDIPSDRAFGISVGTLQKLAKQLGKDHVLAGELWKARWYEARMLAAFVDEPARVTPAQMDRWCRDFDNWAICDTVCFHLFDKSPHAWSKVAKWSTRRHEFEKRAAFALLACLALHDRDADDEPFFESLPRIEQAAGDDRNFVKKAVSWALRAVGSRSRALHAAAIDVARRLAASTEPCPRWIGKDALRSLNAAATRKRLARQ